MGVILENLICLCLHNVPFTYFNEVLIVLVHIRLAEFALLFFKLLYEDPNLRLSILF